MVTAKIIADSINPSGSRLTSFLVTYPRFIHSELMTHRAFSRNAASSRAIPIKRMLEDVIKNPALPERWGAEQKGMQSGEELSDDGDEAPKKCVIYMWDRVKDECLSAASACRHYGLHKSICNRLLEPFAHITVLITASDAGFSNFFALRAHPAAQPEFQVLAYRMLACYLKSKPREIGWGFWHIPDFRPERSLLQIAEEDGIPSFVKIATARCARLSYLTFDGEHSPEKDIALHDQLLTSKHLSPFEHCAQAHQSHVNFAHMSNFDNYDYSGWYQYRKMIEGENQTNADLSAIMATKPEWITV